MSKVIGVDFVPGEKLRTLRNLAGNILTDLFGKSGLFPLYLYEEIYIRSGSIEKEGEEIIMKSSSGKFTKINNDFFCLIEKLAEFPVITLNVRGNDRLFIVVEYCKDLP